MAEAEIFKRLKADHEKHRALLASIDETGDDGPERAELFETFRIDVTAHAASEEMSLYATMLADPDLRDEAQHSVAEHKEIEDYLTELYELDFASSDWLDRFRTMKDRYLHHIDEEEEDMFPVADDELSSETKKELAATFKTEKPREIEKAAEDEPSSDHARE